MKKWILIICLSLLALGMGTVSLAADASLPDLGGGTPRLDRWQDKLENRIDTIEQKKTEMGDHIQQAKSKLEFLKSANEENVGLMEENKQLRDELKVKIKAFMESDDNLPQETADQLRSLKQQMEEHLANLKATVGDIKAIIKDNRSMGKNLDYERLEKANAEISVIQDTRNTELKAINDLLHQMLALIP